MIGDGVVAGAGVDDVGAAAAIDGVVAGAGGDDVGGGRPVTVERRGDRAASRFSKFGDADGVAGGLVDPAATAKFTAVMPPDAASTSVSLPLPPSIEVSVPR